MVDISKERINVLETSVGEALIIHGAAFFTTNVSKKYKREVLTKGLIIYINPTPENKKALDDFGIQVYTPETKDENGNEINYIQTQFVDKVTFYNLDKMKKRRVHIDDDHFNNFNGENFNFAISKMPNTQSEGDFFYRVSSIQGHLKDLKSSAIDYFGDDDKFKDEKLEEAEVEELDKDKN